MLSERIATARRLELTDAVESGDRIEGFFRGVKVSLEDHGLERTLRLDVDRAAKWVSIALRCKDLNDPDVVMTGDAGFDEAITVLAEDGEAPSVGAIFEHAGLRAMARDFFQKFPFASFSGRTLTLPHVGANNPDSSSALQLAAKLVLVLREATDAAPKLRSEPPPVLAKIATQPPRELPQIAAPEEFDVGGTNHMLPVALLWAAIALFAAIFYFASWRLR